MLVLHFAVRKCQQKLMARSILQYTHLLTSACESSGAEIPN